jgi:hypothetical protein
MNTESTEEQTEEKVEDLSPEFQMPNLFADWLVGAQIEIDRDTLKYRWNAISEQISKGFSSIEFRELTYIAMHGIAEDKDDEEHWFKEYFKKHDSLFSIAKGAKKHEITVLAGATIAAYLYYGTNGDGFDDYEEIALLVLCAAFQDADSFEGAINLVPAAQDALHYHSITSRKRPKIKSVIGQNFTDSANQEMDSYAQTPKAAFDTLREEVQRMNLAMANQIKKINNQFETFLSVQDEELNMIWWLLNGKSISLDRELSSLDSGVKALTVAIELGDMTDHTSEISSISAIIEKAGIQSNSEISFKELCNSAAPFLTKFLKKPDEYESHILPVFSALSMAKDGKDWENHFIDNNLLVPAHIKSQLSWALQIHREYLYIKNWC